MFQHVLRNQFALGCLVASLPLITPYAQADDDEELEFDEAHLFFELNDTDGDLGIHGKIDGDEWKSIRIENPNERVIMNVSARGKLRRQGITELFFESAEPTFDELSPDVFFDRFPAGTYEVEGITTDGEEIESETELTHLIPAAPEALLNGMEPDEECSLEFDRDDDVVISWPSVTSSHATLGVPGVPTVVNYEVVVEIDDTPWKAGAILPPELTSFEVPDEILLLGHEIKFEVLVREESYNQSAMESCFTVFGEDD